MKAHEILEEAAQFVTDFEIDVRVECMTSGRVDISDELVAILRYEANMRKFGAIDETSHRLLSIAEKITGKTADS